MAETPVTPEHAGRIANDDSFKTAKATMPTPKTRLQLRQTPARTSILSGGTPFKESSVSVKKFNSRRKKGHNSSKANETGGSNDTFIRCEQDLMFERDSLELVVPHKEEDEEGEESKERPLTKQPTFLKDKLGDEPRETSVHLLGDGVNTSNRKLAPLRSSSTPTSPQYQQQQPPPPPPSSRSPTKKSPSKRSSPQKERKTFKSPQKTFKSPKKNIMAPPASINMSKGGARLNVTRQQQNKANNSNNFVTPKVFYKKPAGLMSTTSRYLSSLNTSRLTRAQSYRSTAELERDYFSSLRSF